MIKGLTNELQGWNEIDFDLPSLHDVEEMFRKCAHITKGVRNDYLRPIAMSVDGFRGHRDFELEGGAYSGFYFFRAEASFFLVFRTSPKRSAKLYYMGRTTESTTVFNAACSKLVLNFDGVLQQFYYSFQKNLVEEPYVP